MEPQPASGSTGVSSEITRHAELAKEENQSTMGSGAAASVPILRNKIMLNKVEFDSIFERWEGAGGTADVLAFLLEVEAVPPGLEPGWYTNVLSLGTNRDHLKLQGVSTVDFNVQNKPYPEHWGKPPNVNFKAPDGVVRDLPGGYGRGNRALYRWVDEHMKHDEETWTNPQNGLGPYPYGNASCGCTPRVGAAARLLGQALPPGLRRASGSHCRAPAKSARARAPAAQGRAQRRRESGGIAPRCGGMTPPARSAWRVLGGIRLEGAGSGGIKDMA